MLTPDLSGVQSCLNLLHLAGDLLSLGNHFAPAFFQDLLLQAAQRSADVGVEGRDAPGPGVVLRLQTGQLCFQPLTLTGGQLSSG